VGSESLAPPHSGMEAMKIRTFALAALLAGGALYAAPNMIIPHINFSGQDAAQVPTPDPGSLGSAPAVDTATPTYPRADIVLLESSVQGTNHCLDTLHSNLANWHDNGYPNQATMVNVLLSCTQARDNMTHYLGCTEGGCPDIPASLRGWQAAHDYAENAYLAAENGAYLLNNKVNPDLSVPISFPNWKIYDANWVYSRQQLDA